MASVSVGRVAALVGTRRTASRARRGFSALLTPIEEFPGIPLTTPSPSKASSASVTTLSNGLTVVSEDASTTSTISLTFPKAGSSSESVSEYGAALANKNMAFKSGSGLSSVVILRNLENQGATPFSTAGRTSATIGYTAAPDRAVSILPLLGTTCSFEKWDVASALEHSKAEAEAANLSAQSILTESLFAAAYGAQSSMGRPFYSSDANKHTVRSFRSTAYVLNGAVLAGTGISDHAAFVRAAEEGFSQTTVGSAAETTDATFIGGETRVFAPSAGYAHVAIAFKGPSSTPLLNVLKHCFGVSGVSAFAAPGLIGVYGGSASAGADSITDSLCAAVTSVPSDDIVTRAKGLAKAEALFALEGGSQSLAYFMTKAVLEAGTFSASEVAAAYDEITAEDVSGAFAAALKSRPALAAVGDISCVPYQATIESRLS